jgi:iron complex outermembrane recepter protein
MHTSILDTACVAARNSKLRSAIRALLLSAACAPALLAAAERGATQDDKPAASGVLDEVVVSARYRREDLQETPISVSAFTGEQLAERGYRNILDLAQAAPNVTLQNATAGRGKSAQTFIRGVGQGDFNFALEPGVGFYIDDVYYATVFGSIFELHDVERIEILRGPQGTLFGKNSEGGAVRFYSQKARGDNSGYVEAGVGDFDQKIVKGAFDIPIIDGELFLRMSAGSKSADGYMDRLDYVCLNPATSGRLRPQTTEAGCKLGTLGGEDIQSFRTSLRWLPNEDIEVNLIGDYTDDHGEPAPQQIIAKTTPANPATDAMTRYSNTVLIPTFGIPADARFVSPNRFATYANFRDAITGVDFPIISTVKSWGLAGIVDWEAPLGLHIKSITGYREYSGAFSSDQALGPFALSLNYNTVAHHQFSQELQISGKALADKLEWTTGAYYFDGYSRNGGYINIPYTGRPDPTGRFPAGTFLPGLYFNQNDPATNTNKSVFAHAILRFTDELSMEAGVRYSEEKKDYTFYRFMPNFHVPPLSLPAQWYPDSTGQFLFPLTTGHAEASRVDPKIGFQYQWTPDLMTYAQYATGYKSGGINPRPTVAADIVPFDEEELNSYEVGAKSEFFGNRLRFNTAVFFSKYKDLQLNATSVNLAGTTSVILTNVGHAEIKGWEGELQMEPVPDFIINAAAGYLDFEIKDLGSAANVAGAPCLSCKPAIVPEWKWNVGAQYSLDLGGLGSLTPRLDYTHQSKTFNDATNRVDNVTEAYGVLNGRLTWRDTEQRWSVALQVMNALDEEYYLSRAVTATLYEGQPAKPRWWTLTVRREFQ